MIWGVDRVPASLRARSGTRGTCWHSRHPGYSTSHGGAVAIAFSHASMKLGANTTSSSHTSTFSSYLTAACHARVCAIVAPRALWGQWDAQKGVATCSFSSWDMVLAKTPSMRVGTIPMAAHCARTARHRAVAVGTLITNAFWRPVLHGGFKLY